MAPRARAAEENIGRAPVTAEALAACADGRGPLGWLSAVSLAVLLGVLYVLWVIVSRLSPLPDMSAFPTTSYRWSTFIMGGVLSGVVEEAAFRGYMQTGLERHDPDNAILITSLVFVASHVTQGLLAVVMLGPGLFAASVLYGLLARRTGTILPGMMIHIAGDLSRTYFGISAATAACYSHPETLSRPSSSPGRAVKHTRAEEKPYLAPEVESRVLA